MSASELNQWLEESEENQKLYAEEDLILEVTEMIWDKLEKKDLNKAELAQTLGKSKSYISQILSGSRNMTLRTLADIAHALNLKPKFHLLEENETTEWVQVGTVAPSLKNLAAINIVNASDDSDWTTPVQTHISNIRARAA